MLTSQIRARSAANVVAATTAQSPMKNTCPINGIKPLLFGSEPASQTPSRVRARRSKLSIIDGLPSMVPNTSKPNDCALWLLAGPCPWKLPGKLLSAPLLKHPFWPKMFRKFQAAMPRMTDRWAQELVRPSVRIKLSAVFHALM